VHLLGVAAGVGDEKKNITKNEKSITKNGKKIVHLFGVAAGV
jgi:hypothetical protein